MAYEFVMVREGIRASLVMRTRCRDDRYFTPVEIESRGEGDDEFKSFRAIIVRQADGSGRLTATVDGEKRELLLPPRTATFFALFHIVEGLPFRTDVAFRFHCLETPELDLKKDHLLVYRGIESVTIERESRQLHRFEHTGRGIRPVQYWVNEEHRLVRVVIDGYKEIVVSDEANAKAAIGDGPGRVTQGQVLVHEITVPSWRTKKVVLALPEGKLNPVRVPPDSQGEAFIKAVEKAGDLLYSGGRHGSFYISSSMVCCPVDYATVLDDLPAIWKLRPVAREANMDCLLGKALLLRTRDGRRALAAILPVDYRSVRFRWLFLGRGDSKLSKEQLAQLLGFEPALALPAAWAGRKGAVAGQASIVRMHSPGASGFGFRQMSTAPLPEKQTRAFTSDPAFWHVVRQTVDITYGGSTKYPRLHVSSETMWTLKQADLRACLAKGVGPVLQGNRRYLANVAPGTLYGLRTIDGRYACISVREVTGERLVFDWLLQPNGSDVFPLSDKATLAWLPAQTESVMTLDDLRAILHSKVLSASEKTKALREAVADGADLNAEDAHGLPLLVQTVGPGQKELVRVLLESGADVSAASKRHAWTALHSAARQGPPDVCRLLLEHGADPAVPVADGRTPLELALTARDKSPETAQALRSAKGKLALREAVLAHDLEEAQRALDAGDDPNKHAPLGTTPLHVAADMGHADMCKLLMERGGDPRIKELHRHKLSALAVAANKGHTAALKVLLDPSKPFDGAGLSEALSWACTYRRAGAARVLLRWGAVPTDLTIEIATSSKDRTIADILMEEGAPIPLRYVARIGRLDRCKELVEAGADINTYSSQSKSALGYAIENGHREITAYLIGKGADLSNVAWKRSALHLAAELRDAESVKLLLRSGANINQKNLQQNTPLYWAVSKHGDMAVAKLLLDNGADPNVVPTRADQGAVKRFSILRVPTVRENRKLRDLLLEYGAR